MSATGGPAGAETPRKTPEILALVGPTASGKTALSLELAEALGAEIVSMDSRQVYRGMDVGTAKPAPQERARVPHHGLDLVDPDERYSAGRFARDARRWIADIRSRHRVPILVGGTGFYLRVLTEPIFREPRLDPDRLGRLRAHLAARSRKTLETWVRALDPERAEVAAEGGPQRLTRTLEVTLLTGRPLSWWHREAPAEAEGLEALVVVLEVPRDELDRRIALRVERMVEEGLVGEVRGLLEAGYGRDAPGMTGVGYRELIDVVGGRTGLEAAKEDMRRATRRYARRQLTWFRNQLPDRGVLRLDATRPSSALVEAIVEAWRRAAGEGTSGSVDRIGDDEGGRR